MSLPLIIVAAGGHGAEIAAYLAGSSENLLGAVDDKAPPGNWQDVKILGDLNYIPHLVERFGPLRYITAVGDNSLRKHVVARLDALGLGVCLQPAVVKQASSWCGLGVEIGEGTLVAPNVLVTTRAVIGRHCILNVKASVSHDCEIGDYCNLNPGVTICGNVFIGEGCFIGAGAVIKEKVRIGVGSIVGAGAVVIRDVPPHSTAIGVPARALPSSLST